MVSGKDALHEQAGRNDMENAVRDLSARLYQQSSQLRGMARMLSADGDTERGPVTFSPVELDGFAAIMAGIADEVDACRDVIR